MDPVQGQGHADQGTSCGQEWPEDVKSMKTSLRGGSCSAGGKGACNTMGTDNILREDVACGADVNMLSVL